MANRDTILKELNELNSKLPVLAPETYTVPEGYFDGLADRVMSRIKAIEAVNFREELNHLSPVIARISSQNLYIVPQDYFEGFAGSVLIKIKNENFSSENSQEELVTISPLLAGLKKDNLYSVPEGYFESLSEGVIATAIPEQPEAKIISITHRKWFRYAAAAVIFGAVALSGILLFSNNTPKPVNEENAWAKVEKKVKKISDSEIEKFIQPDSSIEKNTDIASVKINNKSDSKELVKDISDKDIQNFLDQTSDPDDDDAIFN
jgi:hypothetical protein